MLVFPAGGQQAFKWAGAYSVVQGDQSTISGVGGAQSKIGRADLGLVSWDTMGLGLFQV